MVLRKVLKTVGQSVFLMVVHLVDWTVDLELKLVADLVVLMDRM